MVYSVKVSIFTFPNEVNSIEYIKDTLLSHTYLNSKLIIVITPGIVHVVILVSAASYKNVMISVVYWL